MIVTKAFPYSVIKKQLKKSDEVGVISCNACARLCGTGGEKGMVRLSKQLKKDGFNVVDMDLIGTPCNYDLLNKSQLHGSVQILLACEAGLYNLKKLFPKHKIIPANKTLGLGVHDKGRNIVLVRKIK